MGQICVHDNNTEDHAGQTPWPEPAHKEPGFIFDTQSRHRNINGEHADHHRLSRAYSTTGQLKALTAGLMTAVPEIIQVISEKIFPRLIDETDDFHLPLTMRTVQWINLSYFF